MDHSFLAVLAVFLSCLFIRTAYEAITESGGMDGQSKVSRFPVIVAMIGLWVSWFNLCPLDPLRIPTSFVVQWIGYAIIAIGTALALVAFIQLRGVAFGAFVRTEATVDSSRLVTTGIFARLRHPMYTGFILWFVGCALYNGAIAGSLAGLIGVGSTLYRRKVEERRLRIRYGDAYVQYVAASWF